MSLPATVPRGSWPFRMAVLAACCTGVLGIASAAAIPSWLDDGITKWNTANPQNQIRFVNIKDSFVWYDMQKSPEVGHERIRERADSIVLGHGYEPLDDEELVTTATPPVTTGRSSAKKCWSRSFVLNIQAQDNTRGTEGTSGQRQRMLTRLVCDDTATWWAAFRVAD